MSMDVAGEGRVISCLRAVGGWPGLLGSAPLFG